MLSYPVFVGPIVWWSPGRKLLYKMYAFGSWICTRKKCPTFQKYSKILSTLYLILREIQESVVGKYRVKSTHLAPKIAKEKKVSYFSKTKVLLWVISTVACVDKVLTFATYHTWIGTHNVLCTPPNVRSKYKFWIYFWTHLQNQLIDLSECILQVC